MRISELSAQSGVPASTIKYYLRSGLLPPGQPTAATQAQYQHSHLSRLRLIRVLSEVLGLSVARIALVLGALDQPGEDLYLALGRALAALPPYLPENEEVEETVIGHPLAQQYAAQFDSADMSIRQLEAALDAATQAGLELDQDRLQRYAEAAADLAAFDISALPEQAAESIPAAVLGTALYDQVFSALWRLERRKAMLAKQTRNHLATTAGRESE